MGVVITTLETIENPLETEGDLETEEVAKDIEAENLPTQDKDLTADTVGTLQGLLVDTDKNHIDLRMAEMRGMVGARDTSPKMIEEVSMAMVAGAEKSARRP